MHSACYAATVPCCTIKKGNAPRRKRMNTAASGLFATRDPPDGRSPWTDWRDDKRPATAFPHMLQHACNAAAALVAAPERLRATVNDSHLLETLGNTSLPDLRPRGSAQRLDEALLSTFCAPASALTSAPPHAEGRYAALDLTNF